MPHPSRALLLLMLLAGCDSRTATTALPPSPQPAPAAQTTPATQTISDATPVEPGKIGPIAVGMTRTEAERAISETLLPPHDPAAGADACSYAHLDRAPAGLSFMLTGDTIARIDIDPPAVLRTAEGIGIGSSEADALAAYGSRITTRPRKYEPGRELVVSAPSGATSYVFESDGQTILRYRTGRPPEIDFVERCG